MSLSPDANSDHVAFAQISVILSARRLPAKDLNPRVLTPGATRFAASWSVVVGSAFCLP